MRLVLLASVLMGSLLSAGEFPAPTVDQPASGNHTATAVFAGGCFWGVEAVFERLNGVSDAVSGYAGGAAYTAHYEVVSSGITGHAESVQVTYDPSKISYGKLLEVFFAVAHDPTQLNRQGPDHGTQYRSAIFFSDPDQKRIAEAYIHQLDAAKIFPGAIVTKVVPLNGFYRAEDYHQHYFDHNPNNPYIVYNDAPKVKNLQAQFPQLLKH
ncbi:MAG: peptide-methionine (S)-S-oxide reductase MsrA [Bryobacteraceae bacterium]